MANTHTTLTSLFTDIADAIRLKKNSTETIIADNFPTEIETLKSGFDYINSNVAEISDYEFRNCEDLKSVDCANLESIGIGSFEGCGNLKEVTLYESVTSVGENAFKGCCDVVIYYKGSSVPDTWHENWNPDNRPALCGELVETWDISATEEDNVIAKLYGAGDKYMLYISGSGNMEDYHWESFPCPWNLNDKINTIVVLNSVTSIGNYAFNGCKSLTSIAIPNSVTSIGSGAFNSCENLALITIPDSITSIEDGVFFRCINLCSINIPNNVTHIGYQAFMRCRSLTSITIPKGVTSIGYEAFEDCASLTSIAYTGTTAQWRAITFGYNWNYNTPDYTIYCTDGDIAKDGTITYHDVEGGNE